MNKHTQGQWNEYSKGNYKWVGTNDVRVCIVDTEADNAGVTFDQSEANAALIASAPELLKALQLLSDEVSNYFNNSDTGASWPKFFDGAMLNASTAIRKATGGQS